MMLKIDLEKAFDKLEWSFIHKTLRALNLSQNITNLIMSYVTTSRIAILINGTRMDFFEPSRGIR